jgi:hypothetical protein
MFFTQSPVLVESFSASAFPPAGWDTTRSDTTMTYWIRYQTSGANPDSHHARILTYKTIDSLRQGFSELVTPSLDLETATGEESLSFWYRFSVSGQNMGPDDTLSVAIRDDSTGWCDLWKLGISGQSNTWTIARISLLPFNGYHGAKLRFRFDDRPNSGLGSSNRYFWLDSVKVISYAIGITDGPDIHSTGRRSGHITICPNPGVDTDIRLRITDNCSQITGLRIFDASGRLVKSFSLTGIDHRSSVIWHGDDQAGHAVPAGVYFCESVADGVKDHQSLILIR